MPRRWKTPETADDLQRKETAPRTRRYIAEDSGPQHSLTPAGRGFESLRVHQALKNLRVSSIRNCRFDGHFDSHELLTCQSGPFVRRDHPLRNGVNRVRMSPFSCSRTHTRQAWMKVALDCHAGARPCLARANRPAP